MKGQTIAKPRNEIEATLPDELRTPTMPDEIANPAPFDDSKCPDYGATAAVKVLEKFKPAEFEPGSAGAAAKQKYADALGRQAEWKTGKLAAHNAKTEVAKTKWRADIDANADGERHGIVPRGLTAPPWPA